MEASLQHVITISSKMEDIIRSRIHLKDFEWASRSFTPSEYFVRGEPKKPEEITHLVLHSDPLWYSIYQQTSRKTSKTEDEVREMAKKILVELAHDFHMYSVRWFGVVLAKLSRTLYNGIQVRADMISEVREVYKKYPVILLPTHRSYVDFLLISYISFHYDLALPIIAAGMDFMGMAGVGEMLRKSGAFYIRRTFGGDMLYWSIVSEYVRKALLLGGHPLEMFVEGTRSRSGKSLRPKIGLLSAVLELVRSGEVPDIMILPIAMSYDRTLEETMFSHELLGMPKLRESTQGLLKALIWLGSQSYGSMYVNFGHPISFRAMLESELRVGEKLGSAANYDVFMKAVKHTAEAAVLSHQHCLRVPMFSAVCFILLWKMSRGVWQIKFSAVVKILKQLRILLKSVGSDFGFPLEGDTMEANTRYLIRIHAAILQVEQELVTVKRFNEETVLFMKLQHYANQVLPKLLPFCILSLVLKKRGHETQNLVLGENVMKEIGEDYVFLRRFLREDFLYASQTESTELQSTLSTLQQLSQGNSRNCIREDFSHIFKLLGCGLEPYLMSYWGIMTALFQQLQLSGSSLQGDDEMGLSADASRSQRLFDNDMKSVGKLGQQILLQEMKASLPKQFGALSLETMCNACLALAAYGAAAKTRLPNGAIGIYVRDQDLLAKLRGHVEEFIGASIDNMNWCPVKFALLSSKL